MHATSIQILRWYPLAPLHERGNPDRALVWRICSARVLHIAVAPGTALPGTRHCIDSLCMSAVWLLMLSPSAPPCQVAGLSNHFLYMGTPISFTLPATKTCAFSNPPAS